MKPSWAESLKVSQSEENVSQLVLKFLLDRVSFCGTTGTPMGFKARVDSSLPPLLLSLACNDPQSHLNFQFRYQNEHSVPKTYSQARLILNLVIRHICWSPLKPLSLTSINDQPTFLKTN